MVKHVDAQRLYDDLHHRINTHQLMPGTAIPSENELAGHYAISRPTVRKVIALLCDGGLLERRMGKGTFVRQTEVESPPYPDRPFKLGTDSINAGRFYYADIFSCISSLPYGKNIYLNILDGEESARGIVPEHLDGLFLAKDLLAPAAYQSFIKQDIPVVHINRKCDYPGVSYATVDHFAEAERAVSLLLKTGYKRIMLAGAQNDPRQIASCQRTAAWASAYLKKTGTVPEELQLPAHFAADENFIRKLEVLKPDAFFFVNIAQYDHFALSYAQCTGKSAEHFCTLIFDDVDTKMFNHYSHVNFIRMPIARMTEMCLEYLWKKAQRPDTPLLREVLPCDLILRNEI